MYQPSRTGFPRVPYVRECTYEVDGVERVGLLCNLSVLGAFVDVEPLPEKGREGVLRFELADGGPPMAAAARVAWVKPHAEDAPAQLPEGCGVRFLRLAADEVQRIAAMVAAFEADPLPTGARVEPARSTRIPFVAACVLAGEFGVLRARVCNLSSRGLFVAVDPIPAVGERAIVALTLPGLEGAFERAVEVAWRNADGPGRTLALPLGCGLRFLNLGHEDTLRLDALVDEYLVTLPAPAR